MMIPTDSKPTHNSSQPDEANDDQVAEVKTWDKHRNNPMAEVVLVSKDKIGFRVEAWYIQKHSTIVKNLIEGSASASVSVPYIQLKQNGNIVRHFVESVTSAMPHSIDLSNRGLRDLWDLCRYLRATEIQYIALRGLMSKPGGMDLMGQFEPWEAFKVAAIRGDTELAILSIKAFDRSSTTICDILTTKPASFLEDVPPRYVYALMRSAFVRTEYKAKKASSKRECLGFRTPAEIAAAFTLD